MGSRRTHRVAVTPATRWQVTGAPHPEVRHRAQKSARRPRLMRRPDFSYMVGKDGSMV